MFIKVLKLFKQRCATCVALVLSIFTQAVHADVVCATMWVKGNKKVYVYHDKHDYRSFGQEDYLVDKVILTPKKRTKRLDILVENFCHNTDEQHSDHQRRLLRELAKQTGLDKYGLLGYFSDYVGVDFPNGVRVSSIDIRELSQMVVLYFNENILRTNKRGLLDDAFYESLQQELANVSFESIIAQAHDVLREALICCNGNVIAQRAILDLLIKFGMNVEEYRNKFLTKTNLSKLFLTTPIVDILQKHGQFSSISTQVLYGYLECLIGGYERCEAFLDLVRPAMAAAIIARFANATGDVALFSGYFHSFYAEKYLQIMGYKKLETVNRLQHVSLRRQVYDSEGWTLDDEMSQELEQISKLYYNELLDSFDPRTGKVQIDDSHFFSLPFAPVSKLFGWIVG